MTPVQLFGVATRTVGLVLIFYSTPRVFESLTFVRMGASGDASLASFWAVGIVQLGCAVAVCLAGVWLLRGPKWLSAFAYPEEHGAAQFRPLAADKSPTAAS